MTDRRPACRPAVCWSSFSCTRAGASSATMAARPPICRSSACRHGCCRPSLPFSSAAALLIAAGIMTRFVGARVCRVLRAHCDPVPLAVRRSQSAAAFPEGSGDRGRIPRARLLRTGQLVDRPLPRAVKKLATSRPERSPAGQSRRERRAEAFPQEAGELQPDGSSGPSLRIFAARQAGVLDPLGRRSGRPRKNSIR